ncbi:MAG: peptidylprolyl isomerase [Nocardioidaceae bacterium]|nr:peptidylprolyl isomerase [Nocardioidaceae bacterium]
MIRTLTVALVLPLALVAGCGSSGGGTNAETGPCTYVGTSAEAAKKVDKPSSTPDPKAPTTVTISTSQGDIPVTLDPGKAPCTVNSFLSLAQQGYFDDTQCHRLTTQGAFVLQCGDPSGTGQGGPGYAFDDELIPNDPRLQPCGSVNGKTWCTYNAGTVAMANSGSDTNGSQFFLVYGNSTFEPNYTVFGRFDAAGLKVIKDIAAAGIGTPNGMGPGDGTPKNPVTITSVK